MDMSNVMGINGKKTYDYSTTSSMDMQCKM